MGARFGLFFLDMGHCAWIWAILLRFGLFGRIWGRIGPQGDKALRMGRGEGCTYVHTYVRTDGRTDFPCVLQAFVPFRATAQKTRKGKKEGRNKNKKEKKTERKKKRKNGTKETRNK